MWTDAQLDLWQGRIDGEGPALQRWHQVIDPLPASGALESADVVLGFACDEGVRRNRGRVGAAEGPDALRRALANLPRPTLRALYDGGTVTCDGTRLEAAQEELAGRIAAVIQRGGRPLVLGGGHEVAWGSFLGLKTAAPGIADALGIINIDAHFDLREPGDGSTSGTPFRQIAGALEAEGQTFSYLVAGINPAANTPALFSFARDRGVTWFEDVECVSSELPRIGAALEDFIRRHEGLYLSICLDAFPAAVAPGVSAPGTPGICPRTGVALLRKIRALCASLGTALVLVDIAEMNPRYDRDGMTARLAARLAGEVVNSDA